LAVLKTLKIEKGLLRKGFAKENSNHKFFHLFINNRRTNIYTKISHGKKEIDDYLIGRMASQTGLTKNEFIDLIECPLSYEDYIKLLIERRGDDL